jgi:hypothetical protein
MDGRMIACGISDRPDWPYAGVLCRHKDKPFFNPAKWNAKFAIQIHNNCYNYATCQQTGTFAQPGIGGCGHPAMALTCAEVTAAAKADGLKQRDCDVECPRRCWKVALVIDPLFPDFHWYRQDDDGTWSHKPGGLPATNRDADGNPITDPRAADRDYRRVGGPNYTLFCGCFCVCPPVSVASLDGARGQEFAMAESPIEVTLLRHSGLPNPVWMLSTEQARELARRLKSLPATKPVPLGWIGIAVSNPGRVHGVPENVLLHDGVIEIVRPVEPQTFRDRTQVANWLLGLGTEAGFGSLIEQLIKRRKPSNRKKRGDR